jgi:SAM-dependent methyltransferase
MITEITFQNPQASMPLRVKLDVVCNTPEEEILANVLTNSKAVKDWVKTEDPHDRIAVICGSGPSLADNLDEIKSRQEKGEELFALNGAASFLDRNGIHPDFQVIMDAQPCTAELVGPAKTHLFASQCNPKCFEMAPGAKLWHSTYGDLEVDRQDGFPEHDSDYCLIGSAASVGNTALVLLYAMGYRTIHIYGMDSSHHDGQGHAFHQAINDGDPCTIVHYNGKEFVASFTMKLQADSFIPRAKQLQDAGCEIYVYGSGLLPEMWNHPMSEQEKYESMWKHDQYREVAPGELVADKFIEVAGVKSGDVVIDFGCGTGRGAKKIHDLTGCEFILTDFTSNSLDSDVKAGNWYTFYRHDLTEPFAIHSVLGFCTDVMEHIPPDKVDVVINNIMRASERVFFQISLVDDVCGALIGQPLHLSVHPYEWWLNKFEELGYRVEWSEDQGIAALFYISR